MRGHVKRDLSLTLDAVEESVEDGEQIHSLVSSSVSEMGGLPEFIYTNNLRARSLSICYGRQTRGREAEKEVFAPLGAARQREVSHPCLIYEMLV